jgi:hypothetical protein
MTLWNEIARKLANPSVLTNLCNSAAKLHNAEGWDTHGNAHFPGALINGNWIWPIRSQETDRSS